MAEIDRNDVMTRFEYIERALNSVLSQKDELHKYIVMKWELLRNIVNANSAIQVRGYYSLDEYGKLDLTGSVNVNVYSTSIDDIIDKMIVNAEMKDQTFICPYIGKEYHNTIIEEIDKMITNEKEKQNFPLL